MVDVYVSPTRASWWDVLLSVATRSDESGAIKYRNVYICTRAKINIQINK